MAASKRRTVLQFPAGLSILRGAHHNTIGREADVTRTWFSVIAVGVLAAACAEPNPQAAPAAPASTATVAQPSDADAAPSTSVVPQGPIVGGLPPSALYANPPGTPAYVITPGDPAGRPIPRPGGAPAF
jgi:hypothetical protein